MNLSHHKASELYQKSVDGQLSAKQRAQLDRHLSTCAECQAHAALHLELQDQALAPCPYPAPSRTAIQQTIQKSQTRFRRKQMSLRIINPIQATAWAGAVVALILAVVWIFDNVAPQPNTATPLAASTQPTEPPPTATITQASPEPDSTTVPPPPTLRPVLQPADIPPAITLKTEVLTDTDLNCDNQVERVMVSKAFGSSSTNGQVSLGYAGVAVQVPAQAGYRQVWEYSFEWQKQAWPNMRPQLIPIDHCEKMLALTGWIASTQRLTIFRWNGGSMSVVLDVPEELSSFQTQAPDQPFSITTSVLGPRDPKKGSCEWRETDYAWDGSEFIQIEQRTGVTQPCGGG